MAELTAAYVDLQDVASYRLWRLLSLLGETDGVEVRPYSLDAAAEDSPWPWEVERPTWALELLAMGECARDSGRDVYHRFLDAAFAAVHGSEGHPADPDTWLRLGTEIDVDLDRYTTEGDRWRAEVGLWHREAQDELGVAGVPTLVFDDRHPLRVVLVRELDDVAAGRRLLRDLADIACQPVAEISRPG